MAIHPGLAGIGFPTTDLLFWAYYYSKEHHIMLRILQGRYTGLPTYKPFYVTKVIQNDLEEN